MASYVSYDFVKMGVCATELLAGSDIADLSLLSLDTGEGVAVAGIEVGFLAKGG
jgi:hypothetical protein